MVPRHDPQRREFLRLAGGGVGVLAIVVGTTGGDGASIRVTPTALTDETVRVEIDGLTAGATVTLRASAQSRDGTEWTSRARFEAGADGGVAVPEWAPLDGTYTDADPMGPFWSMRPADLGAAASPAAGTRFVPEGDGYDVTLTATVDGQRVAESTTTRRLFDPAVEQRAVDHDDLVGDLYLPPGEATVPAAIHLHGTGGQPHRTKARLLASHGIAALALQYFGDPDPLPDTLREVPVETVGTAMDWLDEQERVAGPEIGLFGYSRGGTLALLAASHYDDVGAVVGWVPSGVVYEGLDPGRVPAGTSAWSVDGEPVAYLELADADPGPPPTPGLPYFEPPLADASEAELAAASVAVEDVSAPLYLVSVTDDRRWPSTRLCEQVVARLDDSDYDHDYSHDSHEGAGHFMILPYLPTVGTTKTAANVYGGSPAANARANASAWAETVSFLTDHLDG
jgi:nucleolar protein 56